MAVKVILIFGDDAEGFETADRLGVGAPLSGLRTVEAAVVVPAAAPEQRRLGPDLTVRWRDLVGALGVDEANRRWRDLTADAPGAAELVDAAPGVEHDTRANTPDECPACRLDSGHVVDADALAARVAGRVVAVAAERAELVDQADAPELVTTEAHP